MTLALSQKDIEIDVSPQTCALYIFQKIGLTTTLF